MAANQGQPVAEMRLRRVEEYVASHLDCGIGLFNRFQAKRRRAGDAPATANCRASGVHAKALPSSATVWSLVGLADGQSAFLRNEKQSGFAKYGLCPICDVENVPD